MKPPGWYVWVKIKANEIMEVLKMMAEGEEVGEMKFYMNTHTQYGKITSVGIR